MLSYVIDNYSQLANRLSTILLYICVT